MNNQGETSDGATQTAGLYISLAVGIATTLLSVIMFEILRRKIPSIFESRATLHARRDPVDYNQTRVFSPPSPSYRLLGWFRPVMHLELDAIAETHGLDTSLFLRFHRSMAFLFFLLLLPTVPLLPIYFTGSNKKLPSSDILRTVGIQLFSLSNVDRDDSWRFWGTLTADYAVAIIAVIVIYREFTVYAKHRIRYRASQNPANYTILAQDIPSSHASESAIYAYWDRLFPGEVARVYHVRNGKHLVKKQTRFWKAVTQRERAEWEFSKNPKLKGERPTHKTGMCSCLRPKDTAVDSIDYWTERQEHYAKKLTLYQNTREANHAPYTRAAFIVFTNRRAAAVAAQMNFTMKQHEWRISRAPEPRAINWNLLPIPSYQVVIRASLTCLASIALTMFWVIPITAIMGLTSLSGLAGLEINGNEPFNFLNDVETWPPIITGFLESFLPAVILSVFLSLVPLFLRLFVLISRIPSRASVDANVRDWYFNFVVFSNFLFLIVAGSLLNELGEIAERPTRATSFLASSAPKQGAFIMNFVIIKALSETPKELLQIGRVFLRWFFLRFARTKRQRQDKDTGNTEFVFFRYYAISQLIALLGLVYSTISPFIIPACLLYFMSTYIVWKYNLCFSNYNRYQDGGNMYGGALYGVWTGLFLHLVTMVGIFGLNQNPTQSILIIIPTVGVVAYLVQCRHSFGRIAQHGSGLEIMKRVEETDNVDHIPDGFAALYMHPGFEPLPDDIENLNGVDETPGSGKQVEFLDDGDDDDDGGMDLEKGGVSVHTMDVTPAQKADEIEERPAVAKAKSADDWVDAVNVDTSSDHRGSLESP